LHAVLAREELARLPRTLETALLARFDRLEAGLREGLKHAATLGVRFLGRVLLDLLARSEEFGGRAEKVLEGGQRNGIVEAAAPADGHAEGIGAEDAYLFRHVLMQKAAYELQPPSVRAYVHRLAADVIEDCFPDRGEFYSELADHCARAGLGEKELDYLEKAAARAADRFSNTEAIALYRRILTRLDHAGRSASARALRAALGLGSVLQLVGRAKEADEELREQLESAESAGDPDLVVQARRRLGNLTRERGDVDQARRLLQSAIDLAEETGNLRQLGHATCDLGNVYFFLLSDYVRARECFERLLSVSEELGDEEGRARAIGSMGNIYDTMGDYDRAMDCFRRRLAISRETGNRHGQAAAIGSMGIVFRNLGEIDRAVDCQREFLALSEELGDRNYQAVALYNLGRARFSQGDSDAAMECFVRYLGLAEELGDLRGKASAIGSIGLVHRDRGEYRQALRHYAEKLEIARSLDSPSLQAEAHHSSAIALLDDARPAEALLELRTALALYEELGLEVALAEVLLLLGRVHGELSAEAERPDEHRTAAREALQRARSLAQRLEMAALLREIDEVEPGLR
jgi:tetratricopeptide (TPR) repeat protein